MHIIHNTALLVPLRAPQLSIDRSTHFLSSGPSTSVHTLALHSYEYFHNCSVYTVLSRPCASSPRSLMEIRTRQVAYDASYDQCPALPILLLLDSLHSFNRSHCRVHCQSTHLCLFLLFLCIGLYGIHVLLCHVLYCIRIVFVLFYVHFVLDEDCI